MRTLRPSTVVARAKARAKQISEETRRLNKAQKNQLDEEVIDTSPVATPPPSPGPSCSQISPSALTRQDTEGDGSSESTYTIGKKIHALDETAYILLAKRIIACTARGNGYAADLMRVQLAEIEERERLVWERRKAEDERIVAAQMARLLQKRRGVSSEPEYEDEDNVVEEEVDEWEYTDDELEEGPSSSATARPSKKDYTHA